MIRVKNYEPAGGKAHSLDSLTGTITTVPAACATHLTFTPPPLAGGVGVGPNATVEVTGSITVAAAAPVSCAGADFTLTVSGTESVIP